MRFSKLKKGSELRTSAVVLEYYSSLVVVRLQKDIEAQPSAKRSQGWILSIYIFLHLERGLVSAEALLLRNIAINVVLLRTMI